jgi:hypothetical protein
VYREAPGIAGKPREAPGIAGKPRESPTRGVPGIADEDMVQIGRGVSREAPGIAGKPR